MKDVITRKIGYYSLRLALNSDKTLERESRFLKDILSYISGIKAVERRRDLDGERFYYLGDIETFDEDIQTLVFKSASYGTLPKLLDRETLTERDNPRNIMEGEMIRTHAVIRYLKDEALVLLEEFRGGATIRRVSWYLDHFASNLHSARKSQKNYRIEESIIPKGDFLEELSRLKRVQAGTITISKRYLGGEYFDFSDRLSNVKEYIDIDVSAERNSSIFETFVDVYQNFKSAGSKIERIRVSGNNQDDYPAKLDTEIIKKVDHLSFDTDPITKEARTSEILVKMIELIKDI